MSAYLIYLVILYLIQLPEKSTTENIDERIYNGKQADRGTVPYQARCVQKKASGSLTFCGGSLISPQWVVSAGHCAANAVGVTVYLGLVDAKNLSGVLTYIVNSSGIVTNPYYNQTNQQNDVVLYKLPTSVPLDQYPYIQVIGLPSRSQAVAFFDNFNGTISGWGNVNDTSGMPQYLQYAPAHVMPHASCIKYYSANYPITDGMICTDKTVYKTGMCPGDSGGPLAVNTTNGLIVIGTGSWIAGGCSSGAPVVYGYVGQKQVLDWIATTTGIAVKD